MNRHFLSAITMIFFLIGAVDFCTLYAQQTPTHSPIVVRGGSVEFFLVFSTRTTVPVGFRLRRLVEKSQRRRRNPSTQVQFHSAALNRLEVP